MPKEIITESGRDYERGQFWAEVVWGRDTYAQIGVRRESQDPDDALFMHLSRESVNKLIRVLRRARDQAFGADA